MDKTQPAQEPEAWGFRNANGAIYDCISPEAHNDYEGEYDVPLYTKPPKRPWVGLTLDEIEELFQSAAGADEETDIRFARLIEAKLKEKNT